MKCGKGWELGVGGKCVRSKKKRTARQVLGGMLGGLGVAAIGGAAVARFKHLQKQKESARFQSLNDRITQGIADDDRVWEEYRKKEKDALSDGYSADPWAPLSSKAKTSDTDRVAFESLKATDPDLDPWQASARKKKSKPRKKSTKKKRSDSLPKLRDRLDARSKINGQCGKGWTEGPGDKCIRPKGKFDIDYGQKDYGGDAKHRYRKLLLGTGDVEYNRQRSAGVGRGKAFLAGSLSATKGVAQNYLLGGGPLIPYSSKLPGGSVAGSIYRRSRNAGQGRIRAGAKGLAAGMAINVPLSIAAVKYAESLRERVAQNNEQRQQQAVDPRGYSERFAQANRRTPITRESLQKSRKKQQRKNHPDRVSKLQEPAEWDRRNRKAQKVEHSFNEASKKLGIKLDSLARARLRSLLTKEWR